MTVMTSHDQPSAPGDDEHGDVTAAMTSRPTGWVHSRPLWSGLSIIAMWIAVLFVGLFGGDFVSQSAASGYTRFPVVVFMLPFVLPATIVVARHGFAGSDRPSEDRD